MIVFSNLAISVDGKIADKRDPRKPLGTVLDRKTMDVLRARCDAIVIGANTLRVHPDPLKNRAKLKRPPANVIISGSGDLDPGLPFWNHKDTIRFVFTSKRGFEKALYAARDRAFVIEAGEEKVDLRRVLERLKESGMKRVLVEGGGGLMAEFLEARLLHEMFVTVTPWALGGTENPTLVQGPGLTKWAPLKLLKCRKVKDELYLQYRVKGARRV
jgi:riboflavin-specific deaminase-like protein